ncbi:serine/threonine-protein kinase [Piscinibacter sp. XHJ-5]|uniref:serine/threonine-protein kinase n=1 Tax=Piscinibacter sp. XHJ-5 TaxID=3037797 RepID=UPI0024533FA1|nr:serine/threonine-protein kinase [Piscinibacter sp. XHJ-5]
MNDALRLIAAEQWPEIDQLLDDALDLDATERAAWLASLPDTPAKAVLARLLAQQARVESANFLGTLPRLSAEALAHLDDVTAALAPQPGDLVGPWRLLGELGQGGMGAVWLAERADGSLKRQVALKLPNRSWDAALAERMLRERDILATLTHPHIARLYDAGFDEQGRPFLALEYVDGRPIDEHVRGQQLPVKAIIGLLLQVAAAVAHAHSRLVIHRDLKPSNILVDAQGEVRLLDFGIAKLMEGERTEDTALTRAAGRALTLEYASPEQVRGEPLSTASDVYSLGVVAYELLAGCRPYRLRRGTPAELEDAIASVDPPRASEAATDRVVRRALRGDLDAILNKALKKRADARYATVTALAEDLQRHLDGHAVLARPDSRWYVARKFVARHRVPVAAVAGMFAALAIGMTVALWQTATARENLRRATMALEREDGVRTLLVETLAGVAAWDAKTFAEPGSVSRMLQRKLVELEERYRDQPYQRLSLLNTIGTQLPYFGDYEGSLAVWQRYLPLVKAQRGDAQQLLEGHIGAAKALVGLRRWPELEATAREGLAVSASAADVTGTRAELAYHLVLALLQRGARSEARALLQEHARAVAAGEQPGHKVRWDILMALARMDLGYDDVAALQSAQQAHAGYAAHPDASVSQLGLSAMYAGMAHLAVGQREQAETALRTCLQHYDKVFGREDSDAVLALARLSHVVAAQGRYDEARRLLEERRRDVEARSSQPGPDAALARRALLTRQLELAVMHGDLEAAARLVEPVRATYAAALDDRDSSLGIVSEARWLMLSGRAEEARRAVDAWLEKLPSARSALPQALRARLMAAEAEVALGRPERAGPLVDDVLRDLRRIGATRNWTFRQAAELAAVVRAAQGGADEAWATLEQADREPDAVAAPTQVDLAESLMRRAAVLRAAGRSADAAALQARLRDALGGQHAASPRLAWAADKA